MERHNLEKDWQIAVGRFLLSFGKVEWFTYHLLVLLPTERIFDSVKSLSLSQRVILIKDLMNGKDITGEIKENIIEVLTEAESLLHFRNTIAHNPLYMGYYDTADGLGFRQQISKFTKIDEAITLDDLNTRCAQVEDLATRAYSCESAIRRLNLINEKGT